VKRISPSNVILAGFAALALLATAWLLWPWQSGNEPAAFFVPTASATATRVVLHRKPTPTSFVPTATLQPVIHVVQPGEALSLIAEQYDTTMEAILEANGLEDADLISVGQELVIAGAKRTPVVTVVSTPSPIPTPTSRFPYAAPLLIAPRDGAAFHGQEARIGLQWASVAILGESEWYEVKVWSRDQTDAHRFWTKTSNWIVAASLYPGEGDNLFYWNVSVVYRGRRTIPLSPAANVRRFRWH